MKTKLFTIAVFKWICFFMCYLMMHMVEAQNTLTGRVTDGETGEALPGATIMIKGTTLGTVTNLAGEFTLLNIPTGLISLEVNYIGFDTKKIENLDPSQSKYIQVKLSQQTTALDEVVISGQLEGQQKALNQQRSADNIKNIVSADLIGRFPDLNVAEALQRVPGVNISRSRGEGSTVSLRGTPQNFTTININGEQLPSTQQDGSRNESLDLIPADQLASMEITKAITPDMDGDAIGGSVNLRTPVAISPELRMKMEAGGGYNSLSQGFNRIGRFKVGKRFFTNNGENNGKLGLLAGFSYFETDNEEDALEAVWSPFGDTPLISSNEDTVVIENHTLQDLINQRTRTGATFTADYRFNPSNQIIFNFMFSRRSDSDIRNRLRVFLNESAAVQWQSLDTIYQTELRRDITIQENFSENLSYNLQGEHKLFKGQLDWGLFYADSRRVGETLNGRFERGADSRVDLIAPGGIYNDFVAFELFNSETTFFDPFLINEVNRYENVSLSLLASNAVAKFNYELPYRMGSGNGFIKFGAKYRSQTSRKEQNSDLNNFSDPNRVLDQQEGFASVVSEFEDMDFLNNRLRFGASINPGLFQDFVDDNSRLFVYDEICSNRNTFQNTYDAQEDIIAAYLMSRIQFSKVMVLGGFRYETNRVTYDAYEVNNITGAATPITDGTQYDFFLPNIHVKYSPNRNTNIRAAATWSYARANFDDIVPFLQIDEEGSRILAGNPELKPASSLNLDLLAEHYLGNVGILSGGIFYKNINDFQFSRNLRFLRPGDPFYDLFPGFQFRQEQNGEQAIVYGFESNIQSSLGFIDEKLKGLAVYFNYTFTESDAFTSDRDDINLPGQATHTWNGALSYDYKILSLKASVNYNGTFLNTVAGEARNDLVQEGRMQVDLNGSLNFNKHFTVFAEFLNVTNAPVIVYQGVRERIAEYRYFGWWNRFGISYRL